MILYSSECKCGRLYGKPSLSDLEAETVSHIIYFNVLNKKMPLWFIVTLNLFFIQRIIVMIQPYNLIRDKNW